MNSPRIQFPVTERVPAHERPAFDERGIDPDAYFVLPAVPLTNEIEVSVHEGYLMVRGTFMTPVQAVAQNLLYPNQKIADDLIAGMTLKLTVKKARSTIPAVSPATVFAVHATIKYAAVRDLLIAAIPSVAWQINNAIVFTALTFQEATLISYRLQMLKMPGIVDVDAGVTAITPSWLDAENAVVLPHTPTKRTIQSWSTEDVAALWEAALSQASPEEQVGIQAAAAAQGFDFRPVAVDGLPLGTVAEIPYSAGVLRSLLGELGEEG